MIEGILTSKVQTIAILVSIFAIIFVIELIRKRKLKEEYSLLWLFTGLVFLSFSISSDLLKWFSDVIGIRYPPVALIILLIFGILFILLHFSLVISKMSEKQKNFIQELSLFRHEFEEYKSNNKDSSES